MKLPDKFVITIVDATRRIPVRNIAVVLELFATSKNNYTIGPRISDRNGCVEFTRQFCERSVAQDRQLFVMDYVDDIKDCKPFLEVRLHRPESIATMIRNYHKNPSFWGLGFEKPDSFFAKLEKVKNAKYEPTSTRMTEQCLLSAPRLTIMITKQSAGKAR